MVFRYHSCLCNPSGFICHTPSSIPAGVSSMEGGHTNKDAKRPQALVLVVTVPPEIRAGMFICTALTSWPLLHSPPRTPPKSRHQLYLTRYVIRTGVSGMGGRHANKDAKNCILQCQLLVPILKSKERGLPPQLLLGVLHYIYSTNVCGINSYISNDDLINNSSSN